MATSRCVPAVSLGGSQESQIKGVSGPHEKTLGARPALAPPPKFHPSCLPAQLLPLLHSPSSNASSGIPFLLVYYSLPFVSSN